MYDSFISTLFNLYKMFRPQDVFTLVILPTHSPSPQNKTKQKKSKQKKKPLVFPESYLKPKTIISINNVAINMDVT